MRIYLSPSQVATADNCRRQHWYQSIRKVKVSAPSANLVFGSCLDAVAREYLHALSARLPLPDPVQRFLDLWREARSNSPLTYSSKQTPAEFEQMGMDLMRDFPAAWAQTGFHVAQDKNRCPLLNVRLQVSMGMRGQLEVILTGVMDIVAYSANIELGILDMKASREAHTSFYTLCSDQLTAYQILLGTHRELLGLPPIGWLGFWNLLKRKAARIEAPVRVPPRTTQEVLEFREKLFWLAEDIAQARFPKASRLQHNSPCKECDFGRACVQDDEEGLLFPGDGPKKPIPLADAHAAVR